MLATAGLDAYDRLSLRRSNRRDARYPGRVQHAGAKESLGRATNGSRVRTHVLVRSAKDRLLERSRNARNAAPFRLGARRRFAAFHLSLFTYHLSHPCRLPGAHFSGGFGGRSFDVEAGFSGAPASGQDLVEHNRY